MAIGPVRRTLMRSARGAVEVTVLANVRWELLFTSVGLKAVMALSGLVLTGWVFLHMLGNLLVFGDPELINGYGGALQGSPLVWVMRVGLLVLAALHVGAAVVLTRRSRDARATRYRRPQHALRSTISARSMRWGGLFVLLFLAYHVLHIFGPLHAQYVPGDVHHNVVVGLSDPFAGVVYVLATILFGLHLHHGAASLFRSLGHERLFDTALRRASRAFAIVVTVGFLAPCVAALAGWLG